MRPGVLSHVGGDGLTYPADGAVCGARGALKPLVGGPQLALQRLCKRKVVRVVHRALAEFASQMHGANVQVADVHELNIYGKQTLYAVHHRFNGVFTTNHTLVKGVGHFHPHVIGSHHLDIFRYPMMGKSISLSGVFLDSQPLDRHAGIHHYETGHYPPSN